MTFDDVFNDYNDFIKSLIYREEAPVITNMVFFQNDNIIELFKNDSETMQFEIPYNSNISYEVTIINENNNINIYVIYIENII